MHNAQLTIFWIHNWQCTIDNSEFWILNYELNRVTVTVTVNFLSGSLWIMKANRQLWIMNFELWIEQSYSYSCYSWQLTMHKWQLWILNYELWIINPEFWILNFEFWILNSEFWIKKNFHAPPHPPPNPNPPFLPNRKADRGSRPHPAS